MKRKALYKRAAAILLALSLAAGYSAAFAACKNSGTVRIEGWYDETQTAVLGSCYETEDLVAKDENGKEYDVTVNVYHKTNGNEVPLIYGKFDIIDIQGYNVVYTAKDGDTEAAKKKVSVNVKDEGAPVISVGGGRFAELGKRYEFPEITVTDDSGEAAALTKRVLAPDGKEFACDDRGFTPNEIGAYTVKLTATDASGNAGEKSFAVICRRATEKNEIESFDDDGFLTTAYSKSETSDKKLAPAFTAFRRTKQSYGSAAFSSAGGERTGIYLRPRMKDFSAAEEYDYLSAWIYIASEEDVKKVTFGIASVDVPANEWTEIKISSADVGDLRRYLYNVSTNGRELFFAENGTLDYTVFIDDVYAVKSGESDSADAENAETGAAAIGLKEHYAAGEAVKLLLPAGVKAEAYLGGEIIEADESGVLDLRLSGEYALYVHGATRETAVQSYRFSVGGARLTLEKNVWYRRGVAGALPEAFVTADGAETAGKTAYYQIDADTGEKTQIQDNALTVNGDFAFLYVEAEIGASVSAGAGAEKDNGATEKTSVLKIVRGNAYEQNAWFSFEAENAATDASKGNAKSVEKLDEFMGEKNVLKVTLKDDSNEAFIGNRKAWNPVYSKKYYEQFDALVFRIAVSARFNNLSYVGETGWKEVKTQNMPSQVNEWANCYMPIAKILENFDSFANTGLFYLNSPTKGAMIYIAGITCVKYEAAKENSWQGFDSPMPAANTSANNEWLEEFNGETGVLRLDIAFGTDENGAVEAKDTYKYFANRGAWKAAFQKEHYKTASALKIRLYAEMPENTLFALSYIGEDKKWKELTYDLSGKGGEWIEITFDFKTIYENFEAFSSLWLFGLRLNPKEGYSAANGAKASVYIADMYVVFEDETGVKWNGSWQ